MGALGVVIVAAGQGTRMGSALSKQYMLLAGKPIIIHTLQRFEQMPEVAEIVLVVGASDVEYMTIIAKEYRVNKLHTVVAGGSERQYSVALGLNALSERVSWVMVHDGVRPFVELRDVQRLYAEVLHSQAAVLAVPVKDTIKVADEAGWVQSTPPRSSLWAIQTPQAYSLSLLRQAHAEADKAGFIGTDEATLVERIGTRVKIVAGQYHNIKITTPEDLVWGEYWLKEGRRKHDANRTRI